MKDRQSRGFLIHIEHNIAEELYCPDNGRPSINPVVLFKMVMIQRLYGLPSLRRTIEEIKQFSNQGP